MHLAATKPDSLQDMFETVQEEREYWTLIPQVEINLTLTIMSHR